MPCYRTCQFSRTSKADKVLGEMRKQWEIWDLRILTLYILIAQLYLLLFGRHRRKSKKAFMIIVNVWLIYLFSELLATIALGKLSKLKVSDANTKPSTNATDNLNKTTANATANLGEKALRVMWGPLILFYLGGPDTITVLRVEENQLWMRHLIGLLTQGLRAAYALIVTWSREGLSLVALLIFVPGIIKYGERVWVIKTRSKDYQGFVQLELGKLDKISPSRPNAKLVLLAYFWFQTLMPHNPAYKCIGTRVENLVNNFHGMVKARKVDAFKLIEIEMGLMYDVLFSKVGMIFTIWGSILRVLSFSLMVSVLVIYFMCDKPPGPLKLVCNKPPGLLKGDDAMTIILVAGAILLEMGGIFVQLASDWAVVWLCKYRSRCVTPALFPHEILFDKRRRWSEVVGQFSLRDFSTNYEPTWCNKTWESLFGREKMLKRFSSQKSPSPDFKDLIMGYLCEKCFPKDVGKSQTSTQKVAAAHASQASTQKDVGKSQISTEIIDGSETVVQTSPEMVANDVKLPTSGVRRGEWTLDKYNLVQQLKWSIELEFDQSIVIWHVATEICHELDHGKDYMKHRAVKMLSDYMMYLLVVCHSRLPFCNKYQDYAHMKELFNGGSVIPSKQEATNTTPVNAHRLVQALNASSKIKWDIMGSMWAEMLCYAAEECKVKNHIEELRHGGEFLTHVWLLLFHFGLTRKPERRHESTPKDEKDASLKSSVAAGADVGRGKAENDVEEAKFAGGIRTNFDDLNDNKVGSDWEVTQIG